MKMPPGVRKSTGKERRHLAAFLIRKACIVMVGGRILQVNFLMRHIQITAENNRFLLLQLLHIGKKSIFPGHPVIQTLQLLLRIRHIFGDQIIFRIFQCDHTAFVVMLRDSKAIAHGKRLLLYKDSRSGIAFFLRVVPVLVVSRKIHLNLSLLELRLLKAERVRILLLQKLIERSLSHTGAQSVYVP